MFTLTSTQLALLAAGVTAIATAATALLSAIWRWRDRTAASWSATRSWEPDSPGEDYPEGAWAAYATIANVGDGPAYRVWVAGDGCSVHLNDEGHGWAWGLMPVVNPGDTFNVSIDGEFDLWNSSDVVVDWSPPPTRRSRRWLGLRTNRRRQYIPLPHVAPLPTSFDGMGDLRNTPSRWRLIRWRDDVRRKWRAWRR